MKTLIASSLVTIMTAAMLAASPALAEQAAKTELVDLDGNSTQSIQVTHTIDATWVVDNQNVLYRDTARHHYLVTLAQACERLVVRKPFTFRPGDPWQLLAERSYEVRPWAGQPCDVARIAQVDTAAADTLRESALRRVW